MNIIVVSLIVLGSIGIIAAVIFVPEIAGENNSPQLFDNIYNFSASRLQAVPEGNITGHSQ